MGVSSTGVCVTAVLSGFGSRWVTKKHRGTKWVECTKVAILTFWKIVLEIPDTVIKPFVFCWNLEFTEVKASRVFILFSGIFETVKLGKHQSNLLFQKDRNSRGAFNKRYSSFVDFQFFQSRWHVVRYQFCWFPVLQNSNSGPAQVVGPVGLWPYHFLVGRIKNISPTLAWIFTWGCMRLHLGAPKCEGV